METKLKPVIELTNLEAEKELTELLGICWHRFWMRGYGTKTNPFVNKCNCGLERGEGENKPYATSFDAIWPVIQQMNEKTLIRFCDKIHSILIEKPIFGGANSHWIFYMFIAIRDVTPRRLLNTVIEVLGNK